MIIFDKPLIINLKNYNEISGDNSLKIVEEAKRVYLLNHKNIIIAPPPSSLFALSKQGVPIVSQHVDDSVIGATTGFIIPELLKSYGAIGSIINHSEHKIDHSQIKNLIKRLRELDMLSIVCADDMDEVEAIARFSRLPCDRTARANREGNSSIQSKSINHKRFCRIGKADIF